MHLRLQNPDDLSDVETGDIIREGKTVVMISCSIHSIEVGGSQMSMELLQKLATSTDEEIKEILDNVILILVPSLNPDGQKIVYDWYQKYLGTKYEGPSPHTYTTPMLHDNNRDWYMFNLKETHLVIECIHNRWYPQIVYDIHQMGKTGPRFFLSPFTDPYEVNVDPVIIGGLNFMGMGMADALNREGKKGVVVNCVFDAWTPTRAYKHYHGGIRILSEATSVDIASSIELESAELQGRRGSNPLRGDGTIPTLGRVEDGP